MLSIYSDRLGLFSHFYRCLFSYITAWKGSWAGTTAFYIEFAWHCTIAILAWCSVHQLPGCECAVKVSVTPLGHLNAAYIEIYSHIHM